MRGSAEPVSAGGKSAAAARTARHGASPRQSLDSGSAEGRGPGCRPHETLQGEPAAAARPDGSAQPGPVYRKPETRDRDIAADGGSPWQGRGTDPENESIQLHHAALPAGGI